MRGRLASARGCSDARYLEGQAPRDSAPCARASGGDPPTRQLRTERLAVLHAVASSGLFSKRVPQGSSDFMQPFARTSRYCASGGHGAQSPDRFAVRGVQQVELRGRW